MTLESFGGCQDPKEGRVWMSAFLCRVSSLAIVVEYILEHTLSVKGAIRLWLCPINPSISNQG